VDFPDVIAERKRYYRETETYRMIAADVRDGGWLDSTPRGRKAIVVMEGVSMYLTARELQALMGALCAHFEALAVLMDCYTVLAARMSKYKNPINDVGVTRVYGMDDPGPLEGSGLVFVKEHSMTPPHLIDALRGMEKFIFRKVYAGSLSKKLYRLYEFRKP